MSKCPVNNTTQVNLFPADGNDHLPKKDLKTPAWTKSEPMMNQMAHEIKSKLRTMKTSLFKSKFKY